MAVAKDTQQFCVRWNSYQLNLQSAFPKLLTSEHFVDVTLACESRMVKCHKLVLSACSAYFEKLLVQNPCPHPIIFMKDMKYWEVQALVDFMYKGEVNVTQEELGTLLKAAEALEVRGLCGQQHDNSLADKLSLPRDTVMANENVPTQKKRKGENDSKEDNAASSTSTSSMKIEPGTAPSSSTLVPKSPNNQDLNKTNNAPALATPNTSVKQEMNVADNGLFEDLDDDFYQDDNSLQIDETGSAYSLPGPSGQPPLDNSPASSALVYCKTAYGSSALVSGSGSGGNGADCGGDVQQEESQNMFNYDDMEESKDNIFEDSKFDIASTIDESGEDHMGIKFDKDIYGAHCSKKALKSAKRRHISIYHAAAQDLLSGQTLLAVSAAYSIPRSTLHDYMKKSGLLPAWRTSRSTKEKQKSLLP